jgi:hypothetical protein
MARLRIRIELNRGGVGVPLHKLASVVDEAQKFFHMLAEDVRIEKGRGEWLGFDFDHESLNFTAEYVGPVSAEQVRAFYAAFDGTTSLRRGTIDQFARITNAIGEDELIGFGLYQGDEGAEPSEWRCLSRRDALRIADEIQVLLGEDDELNHRESHLPAVADASMGARLFGERRDRGLDPKGMEVESDLYRRLTRVEAKVEEHSGLIRDVRSEAASTEQSFRQLLSAVEGFCDQATRQIERVSPLALPAVAPPPPPPGRFVRIWPIGVAAAAVILLIVGFRLWPARSAQPFEQKVTAASPAPPSPVVPPPTPAVSRPAVMRVELKATEPSWVSLIDANGNKLLVGLLVPGEMRTFELAKAATLRTGNAGGLKVLLDGKPLGPIGTRGYVREIEFKDGHYKLGAGQ